MVTYGKKNERTWIVGNKSQGKGCSESKTKRHFINHAS